jgi:DGQHR domain-containing protein
VADPADVPLADPDTVVVCCPALRVRQPIGEIYIAKMTCSQVQRITYFDVRRRIQAERDIERYLRIQRPLDPRRIEALKKYVNYADATFPTAIIIAIEAEYADYEEGASQLILSNTRKDADRPDRAIRGLCRVIDGQHRIAGLEAFRGENFDVMVSVFVGSDIADQAYIFSTVNLEQNKVNRSLAYDLFELARVRSPYKTCHNIVVALDRAEGGPLFHRIKRLGVSTESRVGELLTQATVVDALVRYISDDPKTDRDLLLKGKSLTRASTDQARQLCFRNLFIDGEDVKIAKIVEEYFKAVRARWGGGLELWWDWIDAK